MENLPLESLGNTQAQAQVDVVYTISQDSAAGLSAEQDKNLKDFFRDQDSLVLRDGQKNGFWMNPGHTNHALQDYQTQLMHSGQQREAPRAIQRARQTAVVTHEELGLTDYQVQLMQHAGQQREARRMRARQEPAVVTHEELGLTDYQMQLMLLEQQNRKRLLDTRQEQDVVTHKKRKQSWATQEVEQMLNSKKRKGEAEIPNSSPGHVIDSAASNLEEEPTFPSAELPFEAQKAFNLDSQSALPNHSALVENVLPNAGLATLQSFPSHSRTLYRITCSSNHFQFYHSSRVFEDIPLPGDGRHQQSREDAPMNPETPSKSCHLNGRLPISDLDKYLEHVGNIAFVIFRRANCWSAMDTSQSEGMVWPESIYVTSSILRSALNAVAGCYIHQVHQTDSPHQTDPFNQTDPDNKNEIFAPHLFLFHHRSLLTKYAADHVEAASHINALLHYTSERYGAAFQEADAFFKLGFVFPQHLTKLFMPNDIVVTTKHGFPVAYALSVWPVVQKDGLVKLDCWSWQMDGSGLARRRTKLSIPPLETQSVRIQKLNVYPLRYAPQELLIRLQHQGNKHWNLRYQSLVSYKGWNVSRDQFYPNSRFMIDHQTYRKMHQYAEAFKFDIATTYHLDPRPPYLSREADPTTDIFTLLPPDTHGFYFTEKKWINLFVDNVQPVTWNKRAYDRLVLPPRTKDLVKALVTVRSLQRGVKQGLGLAGKRVDIIEGKGNGLIMLLHGGPGTGKTLTAESVAEISESPIYRVTCGDIGTSADAVERYLNTVLYLGKTWNCVLLLDEADVFLEERSMSDLKRNSIVSVFLRILEYYDGILILTSNRVGTFDEAFKSRIQVALHYDNLTRSSRKKIWKNFLEMLDEDKEDVNFDELRHHLDELADHDMNGRQIRNVLTTARQLAIYRKERLDWEHLEQAMQVSTDFNTYLKKVQGHSDDQWAREEKLR